MSGEAKFTSGPWRIEQTRISYYIMPERGPWIVHGDLPHETWNWTRDEVNNSRHIANARLIAAAPDLYEVAKAYEQWEADLIMNDRTWDDGIPAPTPAQWDRLLEIQAMRNAALAKVTEQTS